MAVGGGSVIDATKCIAAGTFYEGDAWNLMYDSAKIGRTLPFFAVLTLAATGSEYDNSGVISNPDTDEKLFLAAPNLFPVASIMDPTYTFTVPARHTAAGAADIMSHTFEQYFVAEGNELTDGMCEAMLRTVIKYAPAALKNPEDYEARAQLMMASSFGCCGILSIGRSASAWPCHGIEHEISAYTDITHGAGLAVITPRWMRHTLNEKTAPRFAQYGVRVWGLTQRPISWKRPARPLTARPNSLRRSDFLQGSPKWALLTSTLKRWQSTCLNTGSRSRRPLRRLIKPLSSPF